jgi:oligopeptide transport system substrate-binding protein
VHKGSVKFTPFVIAIAAALVAGCEDGTPVAKATREKILIVGNANEPKGLDPHIVSGVIESNILRALFEGLVVEHPSKDGAALPGVAERWEPNADASEWTFHLRQDAVWSDGQPLTTEDFLFSYQRILTASLASDYSFMLYYIKGAEAYHKGETSDFSTVGVAAPDAHTLVFTLNGPLPFLPDIAKHYTWYPVPKHALLALGKMADKWTGWTKPENLVCNGAFKLKSWRFNDHIEVERNPRYWDIDKVQLNGIRFLPVANGYTETRMFYDGQMHLTYKVPPELVAYSIQHYPEQFRNEPYLATWFIRSNVERKPFDDKRVRHAFSLAFDRKALVDKVTLGNETPATEFLPPFGDYPGSDLVHFDPEKARALLAEAGYPGGKGLPEVDFLTGDKDTAKAIAETLQAMWKEHLGVSVKIRKLEWTSYLTDTFASNFDLAWGGWSGDYFDPLTFLDMWVKDGGNNGTKWSSAEFESLLAEANKSGDNAVRYKLLKQAEELFLDEHPVIPGYHQVRNYMIHESVKNWNPLILDSHPWKFVRLEAR